MDKPVCLFDFENYACKMLPKNTLDFIQDGAGSQLTLNVNRTAFSEFRIRPKLMRNVANRTLSTSILGASVSVPIGISPSACHKFVWPEGECATAKAAEEINTIYIMSTVSTCSIEEVAAVAPNATKWMQVFIQKDRASTANLVKRAEKSGFKAIVLSVDLPVLGRRLGNIRNHITLPPHLKLGNLEEKLSQMDSSMERLADDTLDPSAVWGDIKWLRKLTALPIVAKGIVTAEDALQAVEMGVSAILVSNHGGRQLDSLPATIEVLPEIVEAVGHKVEIYLDGGVREGVDVFKALALGAKMVFVGRPVLWGLTYNGQKGVVDLLQMLKNELDNVIALTGCTTVKDIPKDMVVHKSYYSRL